MVQRPWPIWTTRRVGADLLGRLVAQSHSLVCEWSLRLRWRLTVAGLDAHPEHQKERPDAPGERDARHRAAVPQPGQRFVQAIGLLAIPDQAAENGRYLPRVFCVVSRSRCICEIRSRSSRTEAWLRTHSRTCASASLGTKSWWTRPSLP